MNGFLIGRASKGGSILLARENVCKHSNLVYGVILLIIEVSVLIFVHVTLNL